MGPRLIPCVGAVVVRDDGRLLLVRRGREPARGLWSIPGGKVEPDETDDAATTREVLEETGLRVTVTDYLGTVERDAPHGGVFVIRDYRCVPAPGADPDDVAAADDAEQVGWYDEAGLRSESCVPGLVEALLEWGVLSAPRSSAS